MDNRYYFSKINENKITIAEQEFQHLTRVRRAKVGDEIVGFNGDGNDYLLKIVSIGKNLAECELIDKKINLSTKRPNISVYIASIKSEALNEALDNLTQLNIADITVFTSDYTNVKYDSSKIEKLKNHFIQSCKQCERADLPSVKFIKFDHMIEELKQKDLVLFAYENAEENFLEIKIKDYAKKSIALIVGGEGGFSSYEADILSSLAKRVSLGKTILRAPVAVTAITSAVLSGIGEWHRWKYVF